MRENKACRYKKWDNLPTEELDKVLQAELEKEQPDEEVVLPILHVLEEREKDLLVNETPYTRDLLEKIGAHKRSPRNLSRRNWVSGIAAIAAIVIIIVMAIPQTTGAESTFGVLARWTESIFEFFKPGQEVDNPEVEWSYKTDNPDLQKVYDKVTEVGVTAHIVPMWLPEELQLCDINVTSTPTGARVYAEFKSDRKLVSFTYRKSAEVLTSFEKKENDVVVYDYAGVNHYVFENDEYLSVVWTVKGVECLINTNLSMEDTYSMIKSVYRSDLK